MSPAEIRSIRQVATKVSASSPLTQFVLLWIVWEATRTRLLVIACRKQGWRMSDARKALAAKKISSGAAFRNAWSALTGTSLDNLPGDAGKVWKALQGVERMRHRIVHGFSKHAPEYFTLCATVLEKALDAMPHTLGAVEVTGPDGAKHTIGDPMAIFKGGYKPARGYRSSDELSARFAQKKSRSGGKPPTGEQIKKWIEQGFGTPTVKKATGGDHER